LVLTFVLLFFLLPGGFVIIIVIHIFLFITVAVRYHLIISLFSLVLSFFVFHRHGVGREKSGVVTASAPK
jgi:hypothetical protein